MFNGTYVAGDINHTDYWLEIFELDSRFNITFTNINSTYNGFIHFFNNTNALFHNGTSICNGSSSNINSNDNNININLNPGEPCFVLDEHNVSEISPRQYDVFYYTTANNLTKYIRMNASMTTDMINTTVEFYVNNCSHETLTYVSARGTYQMTFQNHIFSY